MLYATYETKAQISLYTCAIGDLIEVMKINSPSNPGVGM